MEPSARKSNNLFLDPASVKKLLVDFLHDEVTNAGFDRVVIGLSGGVDSSLVAVLLAQAFAPEKILGLTMPYKASNPSSRSDAETLADSLRIRTENIDITPMVDAYQLDEGSDRKLRRGNIMARQRMIVLYDISSRERALVIGTSNKTEILLGYGTLFGDTACALNPIGDLYKTQVWQLAEELGVPKAIIDKKPSADLWEGQTDEGELGFSYRQVDKLLYLMIDERRGDVELIAAGFEKHFIEKVKRLIQRNHFKRRPPLIAKLSNRTMNVDFRYPRDWGI